MKPYISRMKGFIPITLLLIVGCSMASRKQTDSSDTTLKPQDSNEISGKINGASLEMPRNEIKKHELSGLKEMNVEWVAMIPYAFSKPGETFVRWGTGHWWGENPEGIIKCIKMAHEGGMEVMLKPHVWVGGGQGWLGDFEFETDSDWVDWEKEFSNYILSYAKMADSLNVKLFCIGTEVRKSAAKRPHYWRQLIKDVRSVYSGKVTYAANWDNYMKVDFWGELDYIGIDAYFPFSNSAIPDSSELRSGWKNLSPDLKKLSEQHDVPILFTEYGYKSVEYTNMGHWKYKEDTLKTSNAAQKAAYEGLFQNIWQEEFVAGGFFWKYHFAHMMEGDYLDRRYTPQGKEAAVVIKEWYAK